MIIYVWRCDVCGDKGATNIRPFDYSTIHLPCGNPLLIEVFDNTLLTFYD